MENKNPRAAGPQKGNRPIAVFSSFVNPGIHVDVWRSSTPGHYHFGISKSYFNKNIKQWVRTTRLFGTDLVVLQQLIPRALLFMDELIRSKNSLAYRTESEVIAEAQQEPDPTFSDSELDEATPPPEDNPNDPD